MNSLDQLRQERMKKLESLRSMGKNPYPQYNGPRTPIHQARDLMDKEVTVTGRVFSVRGHGKLFFADLHDATGKIQLMMKSDILGDDQFKLAEMIDMGDFVKVTGTVTKTVKGEISVLAQSLEILTKSIRPLPEKWHGLKDIEERYRQRYVDLLVNQDIKEIFLTRTKIVKLLRQYLDDHDFIEVETPVLQPLYGGASANPFITHHKALDINLYLRISDELYLKRLVVGGFEKVYELSKDFRNEGMSKAHNPEFTMLEFYWAYVDYTTVMEFTEQMLSSIVKEIKGSYEVEFKDKKYDFTAPWPRKSFANLYKEYLDMDINTFKTEGELLKYVTEKKLLDDNTAFGFRDILDVVYKKHIRPKLEGPMFITDYPYEMKPLAKRKTDDPTKSASFQLLVGGEEFINAYNELNDPMDQRARWEQDMKLGEKGADDYQVVDEDYIRALEYGMPPTTGWGLGVDRFAAFLTNQHTIKDVILFPTMRPEANTSVKDKVAVGENVQVKIDAPAKSALTITRDIAFKLVDDNIQNKNLVKHCLAVEAAMRGLAKHFHQDEDLWGIVGLLHDADWEVTQPDAALHTRKTMEWLDTHGEHDKQLRDAILAHNYTGNGERPPETPLEWSLYTCDELTGIITACTLVRPDKKLASVEVKSVLKKFNTPSFAAAVDREQIKLCEEKLGIKLEDFIALILKSMQNISDTLGL
jgi:lysyl-tRNA synthetase class 2